MKDQHSEAPISGLGAESEQEMIERQTAAFSPVMFDVLKEITRGQIKHGVQNRPPFEWAMIMLEEAGEVQMAVNQTYFSGVEMNPEYRAEMVQVAAVAMRAIRNYDARLAARNTAAAFPRMAAGPGTPYPTPSEVVAAHRRNIPGGGRVAVFRTGPIAMGYTPDTERQLADMRSAFGTTATPASGHGLPVKTGGDIQISGPCSACGCIHNGMLTAFMQYGETYVLCPSTTKRVYFKDVPGAVKPARPESPETPAVLTTAGPETSVAGNLSGSDFVCAGNAHEAKTAARCEKAPTGYYCSRAEGHEGPCAAHADKL